MKKVFAVCLATVVFCSAILFLPTEKDRMIYEDTIRLHVLANSDSEEDQMRKLAVRDRILTVLSDKMENCSDKEEAEAVILDSRDRILKECRDVLQDMGSDEAVSISLSEEYYPTRRYDEISLPAGKYLSLRVCIGQAEGQNWWCVLYPPVCLGACSAKEKLENSGFGQSQILLVSENKSLRYKVKFKVLESVGGFLGKLFDR